MDMYPNINITDETLTNRVFAKETGKKLVGFMRENLNRDRRETPLEFFNSNTPTVLKIFSKQISEMLNTQASDILEVSLDRDLKLLYAGDVNIKCLLYTNESGLSFTCVSDSDIIDEDGDFKPKGEIILNLGLNNVVYR